MTAAAPTPDLQRIVEALKACRERYYVRLNSHGTAYRVFDHDVAANVFYDTQAGCEHWVDARCAEAMVRAIVPAKLVRLSADAAPGWWHGGHRCDGAITIGPRDERASIGVDLPAVDAELAAEAVNLVRSLSAILGETQP